MISLLSDQRWEPKRGFPVTTHSHAIFEVSAYLRKYDAAVSSYRSEKMKTHSYLPCEELRFPGSELDQAGL